MLSKRLQPCLFALLLLLSGLSVIDSKLHLEWLSFIFKSAMSSWMIGLAAIFIHIPFDCRARAACRTSIQAHQVLLILLCWLVHSATSTRTILLRGAVMPILFSWNLVQDGELDIVEHLLLVSHSQPLDDICQYALTGWFGDLQSTIGCLVPIHKVLFCQSLSSRRSIINLNKTRNNFVGNVFRWGVQHFFQLLGWEALYYDILLFFSKLVLLLEFLKLSLLGLSTCTKSTALPIN